MRLWATAKYVGISDEEFWNSTIQEVEAVLQLHADARRDAMLRAGLIAATIVNMAPFRKRGSRMLHPRDFIREPRRDSDYMSVEESQRVLDAWARQSQRYFASNPEQAKKNVIEKATARRHQEAERG